MVFESTLVSIVLDEPLWFGFEIILSIIIIRLHRYWWRMLETKYVDDNFEMLVTVLADFITNILYLLALASGTNNQKMSPISKFHLSPTSM